MNITLQFHPDWPYAGGLVIESLARDGVYRSQFETGTSNGGLTAHPGGDRWRWESRLFGGSALTPDLVGDAARSGDHDPQGIKRVWHYLARFGRAA